MKRDMELIRKILMVIEEQYVSHPIPNLVIEGYDRENIAYHCNLLHDAGIIDDFEQNLDLSGRIVLYHVGSLTWEGHEFLDKIRDDKIWSKTREVMISKGIPFIFDAVKEVASSIISGMIQGAMKGMTF